MAIPGTNIRTLRRQMGLSQRDVAKATGIDLGNLSKLEAGKIGYSRDSIEKIAKLLSVSLSVLFADPDIVEAAALRMRPAPLLTPKQLGAWNGPDDPEFEAEQIFLHVALDQASRYIFALTVLDDRNAPLAMINDNLIFDAKRQPTEGSIVVAQDDADDVYIGRFHSNRAQRKDETFEVIPIADFSRYTSPVTHRGLKLRGSLVELRRYFR